MERSRAERDIAGWGATFLVAVLQAASPASAEPVVFLDPPCQEVELGEILTLQLSINESGDPISCFFAVLSFDPGEVDVLDVREGALFADSPHPTFPTWEQPHPDSVEASNCVLGEGTFILGPGSLAEIEIEGLVNDVIEPLRIEFIDLRDADRMPYPSIKVVDCQAAGIATEDGQAVAPPRLAAWPNPAPGWARIAVLGAEAEGSGPVSIYDASGRLRRVLHGDGRLRIWDGRDGRGRPLPPGLYLLRGGAGEELSTKLVLAR